MGWRPRREFRRRAQADADLSRRDYAIEGSRPPARSSEPARVGNPKTSDRRLARAACPRCGMTNRRDGFSPSTHFIWLIARISNLVSSPSGSPPRFLSLLFPPAPFPIVVCVKFRRSHISRFFPFLFLLGKTSRSVDVKKHHEIMTQMLLQLSRCAGSKKSHPELQWPLESFSFYFSTPAQTNPTKEGAGTSRMLSLLFFSAFLSLFLESCEKALQAQLVGALQPIWREIQRKSLEAIFEACDCVSLGFRCMAVGAGAAVLRCVLESNASCAFSIFFWESMREALISKTL